MRKLIDSISMDLDEGVGAPTEQDLIEASRNLATAFNLIKKSEMAIKMANAAVMMDSVAKNSVKSLTKHRANIGTAERDVIRVATAIRDMVGNEDINEAAEGREMAYLEKALKEMKKGIDSALKEIQKDGSSLGPAGKGLLKRIESAPNEYWFRALTGGAMPPKWKK